MYKLILVSLLSIAAFDSHAGLQSSGGAAVKAVDFGSPFEEQRATILTALGDGKTYAEISPENREKVRGALDRMAATINGRPVGDLLEKDRVQVFNDQELVNTLLTQAREDSRLVCTREKPTGSHRAANVCRTVAERRRTQDNTRRELQQMQHRPLSGNK